MLVLPGGEVMQRIRISYEKGRELQYTGNLDMHKVWERTFRRAHLPLAYSQGFHPQPKIQQAAPLPLGFTSKAENLDVWMDTDEPVEAIAKVLVKTAQPGITIRNVTVIPLTDDALPNQVTAVHYTVTLDELHDLPGLQKKITNLLSLVTIERERRGKKYDLRPLIQKLSLTEGNPPCLQLELTSLPGATGRPEEVLEELGIDPYSVDIERSAMVLLKK
jgi:radical SAM-linked protein